MSNWTLLCPDCNKLHDIVGDHNGPDTHCECGWEISQYNL